MTHEIIPGSRDLTYPGHSCNFRGGVDKFIHNLSSYGPEFDDGSSIAFDIERTVCWNRRIELLPFTYSLMISYSSLPPSTQEEIDMNRKRFIGTASGLDGFIPERSEDSILVYKNPSVHDIFIDWMYDPQLGLDEVTIAVIQDKQLPNLRMVIESLPYAVQVFNKLSPRLLEESVVQESIIIANESDLVIPRRREEKESYVIDTVNGLIA